MWDTNRVCPELLSGACCLFAFATLGQAPPDSDNDGISDLDDACPQAPGYEVSPFGRGCPLGRDANGNWCNRGEQSIGGVCVPADETFVEGTRPPPPPEPTGIDAFCSNPGNWSHSQCGGSSGTDGGNGGGSGGDSDASDVGDESDNSSEEEEEEEDRFDPNRPEPIQDAIDNALRCILHPDSSEITRYENTVRIEFGTIREEGVVAKYICEASYMIIDKARVHAPAEYLGGHWNTIMWSVLMHEFIHVDNHRNHGCPPWENTNFAPTTEREEEEYTKNRAFEEYRLQTGRRSPFDPAYGQLDIYIACPSQQ